MRDEPLNLVISGSGGQGNVLAAQWVGEALIRAGRRITVGDTYGLSQRGGSVMSHIRVSKERRYGPLIPGGRAHVILGLEPVETLRVLIAYGNRSVVTLTNTRPVYPQGVIAGENEYPSEERLLSALNELSERTYWVPATEIARGLGDPIMANVVMIGALWGSGVLPAEPSTISAVLEDRLPASKLEANRRAFDTGFQWAVNSKG